MVTLHTYKGIDHMDERAWTESELFDLLQRHLAQGYHYLSVVWYGDEHSKEGRYNIHNIAIECETCGEVVVDFEQSSI